MYKTVQIALIAAFSMGSTLVYADDHGRKDQVERRTPRESQAIVNDHLPRRTPGKIKKHDRGVTPAYDRDGNRIEPSGNPHGVPPGLAKKPGGMPPGQYKKLHPVYR